MIGVSMRNIEVRARDVVTGEILTQLYMGQCFQWVNHERQNNIIIEQSTGLKDKKGVGIFEGDIIKSDFYGDNVDWDDIAAISYDDTFAKFVFNKGDGEQDAFVEAMEFGCFEIIGNIHQHSDLLKG